jgi:hypothetical protein
MSSLGRGPGDAGVVHQDVEPAEAALRLLEQPLHVRELRHIGLGLAYQGHFASHPGERSLVDIADMDARAVRAERGDDRPADAGCAGSHQHAPALEGIFHGMLPFADR